MNLLVGTGFDAHRFSEEKPLVLGGVRIENSPGLEGHSDADVLVHAIMDAFLGAIADGDIGRHFPDSNNEWKGADSIKLAEIVRERLRLKRSEPVNIDSTVLAESPRLAPYIDAMRRRIAAAFNMPVERVSVKATTCEGMGAIGRKEGICAMASVLVAQE